MPSTILLVDDYPPNLLALEAALQPLEQRLVKATSGNEALKFLLAESCSLILLDVNMPGIDGFETAALIRSKPRTREIPILFLTATAGKERAKEAYEVGGVDYIVRPFEPEVLRTKVRALLELRERSRRLEQDLARTENALAQEQRLQIQAERRLQRRYRGLMETTGQIVWSTNAAGEMVEEWPAWRAFTGQSREQSKGEGWLEAVHPDDRERARRAWEEAVAGKRRLEIEYRLRKHDGAWADTLARAVPVLDDDGNVLEWLGTNIDLTEHKRVAQLLSEAGRVLGSSLESESTLENIARVVVPRLADWCAIHLRDEEGALRLLTVVDGDPGKEAEVRAATGPQALDPARAGGVAAVLRTGATECGRTFIIVPLRARGQVLGTLFLSRAESGRSYDPADVRIAEELADRAAAALDNANLYRREQEAVRARDDFLSIASHELRTPLTPLRLQTQILRRLLEGGDLPPRERLVKSLDTLERQTDRLERLVTDLLDVSRISAGKLTLQREPVDLAEVAREVVERYAGSAPARISLSAASATGSWDRTRLEQVATNLLVNAIKYGEGNPIDVIVHREAGRAALLVRDRGIGIASADAKRIFGRFERAASASSFGGLGLGLYIAEQIVRAHAGTISVQSAGPGKGSTFRLELPLDEGTAGS